MRRPLTLAATVIAAVACTQSAEPEQSAAAKAPVVEAPAPQPDPTAPASEGKARSLPDGLVPGTLFYGIYLQGNKVGWMEQSVRAGERIRIASTLHAQVRGLGTEKKVELVEAREYSYDGALLSLFFEQTADTGSTRVDAKVQDGTLNATIQSGGASKLYRAPVAESLDDVLAPIRLARGGKAGATAKSSKFDASVLQQLDTQYKVERRETRSFAGVETETSKILGETVQLGISDTSWYDETGKVLEARIGGYFVARLEPEESAKQIDYSQDLLIAAVVKPPEPIQNPTALESLVLTVKGFASTSLPPETPRQRVAAKGERVKINLSRDPIPKASLGGAVSSELAEFVEPTPFIQSDDPAVKEAARTAVGDASDVFTATKRLTEFVYSAVRDEYIPAYSNAKEALESGRGDCTEHSILFVALARALNIPSRVAVGVAYWPPGGGFGWHAWAEVYADGRWIAVDPTWNQPIADATHLKLAGGGPAEQARIVMMLGQLEITEMNGSSGG